MWIECVCWLRLELELEQALRFRYYIVVKGGKYVRQKSRAFFSIFTRDSERWATAIAAGMLPVPHSSAYPIPVTHILINYVIKYTTTVCDLTSPYPVRQMDGTKQIS